MEKTIDNLQAVNRILVTGSNKGIGFACIERLINEFSPEQSTSPQRLEIIMTSRELDAGQASLEKLHKLLESKPEPLKPSVKLVQLDLNDEQSRNTFVQNCPELSVLINNAGIMFPGRHMNDTIILKTLNTNYYNTRKLTESLVLAGKIVTGGRIIFVSSKLGDPCRLSSKHAEAAKLLLKYTSKSGGEFQLQDLEILCAMYETEVKDPKLKSQWPNSVYAVSKLFITLFANTFARNTGITQQGITVFACCPGWCQTDLTKGSNAPLSAYEGSATPVFLATSRSSQLASGAFYFDKQPFSFT